jgi:hypothetical protein
MRYGYIVLVICLAGFSAQAAGQVTHSIHFSEPELLEWDIDAPGKTISDTFTKIQMKDAPLMAHPGEPQVPMQPVTLLLPQHESLSGITVTYSGWKKMPGSFMLAPGQRSYPLSRPGQQLFTGPDPLIYKNPDWFPAENYSEPRIFWCKGYQVIILNLYPVRYQPVNGVIRVANAADIILHTVPADTRADRVLCRDLETDREWIAGKVENPGLAASYRPESPEKGLLQNRDEYRYVIISNNTLINTPGPNNFQELLAFKASRGISGIIKPVEDIYAEYPGADNQQKIRNFCIDAYENWNTEYILLGGDHQIIPARGCYATAEGYQDNTIPTDMYFGCLDGDWNSNGNTRYGEVDDGPGGTEPDIFAELYIGRASVDTETQLRNFVSKTIAYETDNYQEDWAEKALLLGEYLWPQTYGGDYMDELWYGSDLWGYSTPGYPAGWDIDHLYERESSWGSSQLIPKLNSNDLHWVNHLGHASESSVMHLYTSSVQNLTNARPFVVYSQGCYAGAFDTTDCIAEYFSWSAGGAFAVLMNGRYGWGEIGCTDGPGQYFHRQFHDAFFSENIREIGRMNADSKEDNAWCMNYKANRWSCYEINLLGCPQTPLFGRITTRGQITFDQPAYSSDDTLVCTVQDIDLNLDPDSVDTVDISFATDQGDAEILTLVETGMNTCIFTGTITIQNAPPVPDDAVLNVSEGDEITGTYIDEDDGFGGIAIPVSTTAVIDDTIPVISDVDVLFVDDTTAVITWNTDEPCDSKVLYGTGTPDMETAVQGLMTDHSVTLTSLDSCTDYVYAVRSSDGAGNTAEDDNGGAYHAFTTMVRIYVLQENMDVDPNWTISGGDWEFGQPTGQPAGPGADPTSGVDGPYIYGTNLNGAYAGGSTPYHLTTPALDCSAAFGVRFSFYQWLAVDAYSSHQAHISVSNDGSTWHTIYTNPNSNLYDYAWTRYEYDISEYADGQPAVYIRWTMGPSGTGYVGGWNIDNVEVSYAAPCNVPILIHHTHDIDDSAGNNDGMINPMETILMDVTAWNAGIAGTDITAYLSSSNPNVQITQNTAAFPDIPSGDYGQTLTPFAFDVGEAAVNGEILDFTVTYYFNDGSGTFSFYETVSGADIRLDSVTIDDSGDHDGILDPGETATLVINLENLGPMGLTGVTGIISSNEPDYLVLIDDESVFENISGYGAGQSVSPHFTIQAASHTPDPTIVTVTLQLLANEAVAYVSFDVEITTSNFIRRFYWDMDTDPEWTAEGMWEWGVPQGNSGDPAAGYTGDNVYGYNLAGAYTNNMPETYLTTGPIDCSNLENVEVRFMRWLGVESSTWDHASFRVSDGVTWTTIWDHTGSSFTDPDWQAMTYDISAIADNQPEVYLRWVMGTTDVSVVYCGWNIDDVEIWADSYSDPCINDGDCNFDGVVTSSDAQMAFQIALGVIQPTMQEECAADCNGDGLVTVGDAQQIFMTALGMTSCADPLALEMLGEQLIERAVTGPVDLKIHDISAGWLDIALVLNENHGEMDAFWLECIVDTGFALADCRPGDLNPNWVHFGCHNPEPGRIRLGAFNDGYSDPVIPAGTAGVLAYLTLEGPVDPAQSDAILPITVFRIADDL